LYISDLKVKKSETENNGFQTCNIFLFAVQHKNYKFKKKTVFKTSFNAFERNLKISPGIIEKLDHFVDIGIGGVWLSPIFKSPMKDFGYDVSDFREIDPIFGTMADFETLLEGCKLRGISNRIMIRN
jgi:Alpha amylase, catalytic domain